MSNIFWTSEAIVPELSASERVMRDRFVTQYVLDYDAKAAAIRIGFGEAFAEAYSAKYLAEPYVLQQIKKHETALAEDPDAEEADTRRRVRSALLREAYYTGPGSSHSARVSALSKLAALMGMENDSKSKADMANRGGVMEVPAIGTLEAWGAEAAAQQAKLQRDAEEV